MVLKNGNPSQKSWKLILRTFILQASCGGGCGGAIHPGAIHPGAIHTHTLQPGAIQEKEGIKFCHLATLLRDWLDVRNSCGGWDAVDVAKNTVVFGQILSGVEYIHSQVRLAVDLSQLSQVSYTAEWGCRLTVGSD